jgi:hypothetical protein
MPLSPEEHHERVYRELLCSVSGMALPWDGGTAEAVLDPPLLWTITRPGEATTTAEGVEKTTLYRQLHPLGQTPTRQELLDSITQMTMSGYEQFPEDNIYTATRTPNGWLYRTPQGQEALKEVEIFDASWKLAWLAAGHCGIDAHGTIIDLDA